MDAGELTRILDELQGRLDGPAKYVFELTVRQVVIEAWVPLVVLVVALVTFGLSTLTLWMHERRCPSKTCEHFMWLCAFGTAAGSLLVAGGAGVLFVIDGLPRLLNPEYAALERLLSLVVPA